MLRRIALLVAAATCLEAGAQPMSVSTQGGGALVWQGQCVRTNSVRDQRSDPCPNIEDYAGRTRKDVQEELKRSGNRHVLTIRNLVEPEEDGDVVLAQSPLPADFADSGWPRTNHVVLLFGRKVPAETMKEPPVIECKKPANPVVEEKCIKPPIERKAKVPNLVGGTALQALARARAAGFGIEESTRTPQNSEKKIEHQWPAAGREAPAGSVIEYLFAQAPQGSQCQKGQECQPIGGQRCQVGEICTKPPPEACGSDGKPCPEPATFVPVPVEGVDTHTTLILGGAAGGAGLAGGYLLSRLLRRRQDEEEEATAADAVARVVLNARVHPDRKGVQQVEGS